MPESRATVCDRCERLISRDSKVCPYCGVPRAGSRAAEWLREWVSGRSVVKLLLAANVAMFVVALALSGPAALALEGRGFFDLLGPRWEVSLFLGAFEPSAVKEDGEVWRLLTAAFLHAGVLHLVFNMSWLRSVGSLLEEEFGAFRFAIVYLGSALAGSLACLTVDSGALGASGAVFGLLGAGWAHGRRRGGVWGAQVRRQFLAWAIGGVVFTLLMSSVVSAPGHFGGLAGGLALGWVLSPTWRRRGGTNRENRWITLLGAALLACVPLAFVLDVAVGLLAPSRASIPFRVGGFERLERWPLRPLDLAPLGAPGWTIEVPRAWDERTDADSKKLSLDGGLGIRITIVVAEGEWAREPLEKIAASAAGGPDSLRITTDPSAAANDQELDAESRAADGTQGRLHLRRIAADRLLLVRTDALGNAPMEWRVLHQRVIGSLRRE